LTFRWNAIAYLKPFVKGGKEIYFMGIDFAPLMTKQDEQKLRDLASGIVRGIEEPQTILDRLGLTSNDYSELSETRMFRQMLRTAQDEWEGASNTHKRIKLKAAVNIEEALPHFYKAMTSDREPLSSKVKAFEVVSRVAGLGQAEPMAAGAGQFFKLEINLGGGASPLVLARGVESVVLEHETAGITQSNLFATLPLEDL
jgi:hypothetical protein